MGVIAGFKGAGTDEYAKIIQRCTWCGEECNKGSLYCKHGCAKAAGRREMVAENEAIFAKNGLTYEPPKAV